MSNATKTKPKAKRYVKRLNLSLAERAVILHACGEATQPASQMGGGMAAMFHLCEVQRELDEERLQEEIRVEFDRDRPRLVGADHGRRRRHVAARHGARRGRRAERNQRDVDASVGLSFGSTTRVETMP